MNTNSIKGNVQLNNPIVGSKKPLGLQIQFSTSSSNDYPEGIWLGSSEVDDAGNFEVLYFSEQISVTNLVYQIFQGKHLIKSGITQYSQFINITIESSEFDLNVPDDSLFSANVDYTVIRGSVSLKEIGVPASPVLPGLVRVVLKKNKFRAHESIAATILDKFGNFELKFPFRTLFPSTEFEFNEFPQVVLEVVAENSTLATSLPISVIQNHLTSHLIIDNKEHFAHFNTEFAFVDRNINEITGLTSGNYHTITTSGINPEINVVTINSGLEFGTVNSIIIASGYASAFNIEIQHLYALIRAGKKDIGSISSLSDDMIESIIQDAEIGFIISEVGNIQDTITTLRSVAISLELKDINDDGIELEILLDSILNDAAKVLKFMTIRDKYQNQGIEALWDEVESEMGSADSDKLQLGFQIIGIVGLQAEMVAALINYQTPFRTFIAEANVSTIQSFIQQVCISHQKLCVPRIVRGDVPEQDYNNPTIHNAYAQKINEAGKQLFLTSTILNILANDQQFRAQFVSPTDMTQFLSQNPSFDFRVNNVWDDALNITKALREDLMPLQNLARLTSGKIDIIVALIKNGIKSSHQIASMSASEFLDIVAQVHYNSDILTSIYNKSKLINFQINNNYLQLFPGNFVENVTLDYNPKLWSSDQTSTPGFPELESLFGNMDFCSCSDCSSMYSPSAYFTDLFNFIKTRLGSTLPYDELVRRRPDLPHIDISCKNANTELPYIDLVNEQLELIILRDIKEHDEGESGLFIPSSFQTSTGVQELRAYPEHVYKEEVGESYKDYYHYRKVYDKRLSKAIYPNTLPFNLALEEIRVFLRHMDKERYDLMKGYSPREYSDNLDFLKINQYNQAAEWFLISRNTADIITNNSNPDLTENLWEYYGFTTEGTWYNDLCDDLETLLKRTQIEYKDLLQLLITDFLNPLSGSPLERRFAIVSKPGKPIDSCSVEDLMLEYRPLGDEDINAAKIGLFERIHRFVRLHSASKWSIYQLDIVLKSLAATDIDIERFIQIYKTSKLAKKHKIKPELISILWSDIDTESYINFNSGKQDASPSVYDTFFRNKGIINPVDPNFEDPHSIIGTVEENKATILAAYNIEEADLYLAFGNDLEIPTTLAQLSKLYAQVLGAKLAGRTSGAEMRDDLATLGIELPSGSIADLLDGWIDLLSKVHIADQLAFSIPELKYLFRHIDSDNLFVKSDLYIQEFFEILRTELNKSLNNFDLDTDPLEDPNVEIIKARLGKQIIQQFAAQFNVDFYLIQYLLSEKFEIGILPDSVLNILVTNEFINSTLPVLRANSIANLEFDDLFDLFNRSSKAVMIAQRLRMDSDLFILLQDKSLALSILDTANLPVISIPNSDPHLLDQFYNLNDWFVVRDTLGLDNANLSKLIEVSIDESASTNDFWKDTVSSIAAWNAEDLEFLLSDGVYPSNGVLELRFDPENATENDYRFAKVLIQIKDIMDNSQKLGLIVKSIYSILLPNADSELSALLRKTAKAKYEEVQWYPIIKPLQDILRRKQRNALVAYILANPNLIPENNLRLESEHDLFAYLLIDVGMESCMNTTRLKQGISSLQLFLDRIILNIEKVNDTGVIISISDELVSQWQTWRKWYRVWEANRKVFLYPENWLEPELRDNKSHLFKELESFLLQDELQGSYVEEGFKQYLHGLDDISRMEPVAAYHETSPGTDVFHVISRTNVSPHSYYYRKYIDNEWTNWERIDIDIKGDHIAPVFFNNKLHIFWLTFINRKNMFPVPPLAPSPPSKKWVDVLNTVGGGYKDFRILPVVEDGRDITCDVMLNWTYLQDQKWQKHQIGKEVMQMEIGRYEINVTEQDSYGSAESNQAFKTFTKKGDIKQEDFFKNRIYLLAPENTFSSDEGIIFNLVFPGGWNESGKGFHSFRWLGDVTREPEVVKDTEYSYTLLAPYGTRFDRMKFVQDRFLGNSLRKDTTYDRVKTGHFTFSDNSFINNSNTWFRKGTPITILENTPNGSFRLTGLAANKQFKDGDFSRIDSRFFFEDNKNTYYVEKIAGSSIPSASVTSLYVAGKVSPAAAIESALSLYPLVVPSHLSFADSVPMIDKAPIASSLTPNSFRFHTFYHAQINRYIGALNKNGVSGLLTLQNQSQEDTMNFASSYQPTSMVHAFYPANNVQFNYSDPYSIYNWELFFHAPMMIAQRLSSNLKFEDAQKWYHFIFDPTSNTDINGNTITSNRRFWKFYPFYQESGYPAQTLAQLLEAIHNNNAEAVAQVKKWENNPFNPHLIARMRILAYMKNVLMKYLDNLIAWGDQLYRRDTIESINEATQLYVLAANILGERPREIPARVKRKDYTFDELSAFGLDIFSNALVEIESFFAPNDAPSGSGMYGTSVEPNPNDIKIPLHTFYFCLPPNDKLLKYWDTIADRLFKIRNCMNLDGVSRQLPLFEPPIDPALLVKTTAMGIDIDSVLEEVYGVNAPHYRFIYIVQKANEIVNDVKSLGAAILAALEKKDAEALSLLRSTQELALLDKIRLVKIQQVNEAIASVEAALLSKENIQLRFDYYNSRTFMNDKEAKQQEHLRVANNLQVIQGVLQTVSGALSALPTFHVQAVASGLSHGGLQLANVCQAASVAVGIKTTIENFKATEAGLIGGYDRRNDEWNFQKDSAANELQQVERQILAAEIRLDIAKKELENHDIQMENSLQADAFMRSKFSNVDLYNWISTQLASVYFQSYQLALDTARKADFCYRYELPERSYPTDGFIKVGYWDSLKKGLISGERLQLDVRRMETAYMDENARELELTKNVSIALFAPEALLELKRTGTCTVEIPELLYDLDYPGQFMRRIKSVSLTLPCIAGPYTTINCQLFQDSSKYRKNKIVTGGYNDPSNFTEVTSQLIVATSSGQNDSGVFELNFRDERYLPFEGTGAISRWIISFPDEYRQFDYDTITDVIFHIKYTARYDVGLEAVAVQNLKESFEANLGSENVLQRFYSLKHEFSNEWFAYVKALEQETGDPFKFILKQDQFPFFTQGRNITIKKWYLQLNPKRKGIEVNVAETALGINLTLEDNELGISGSVTIALTDPGLEANMDLEFNTGFDISDIEDMYLVADYILEDV